jgi:cytoskeletal protein CcmA (bactofilin family)
MGIFGKAPETKPAEPLGKLTLTPSAAPPTPAAAPPAKVAPSGSAPLCVVGPHTIIKGEITGEEDVLVEGRVEGEIKIAKNLRVGPGGTVKATVQAASVVISGELVGDCQATERVEIQVSGRLIGNIRTPRVVIQEGAMFRGNSDMSGRKDREG